MSQTLFTASRRAILALSPLICAGAFAETPEDRIEALLKRVDSLERRIQELEGDRLGRPVVPPPEPRRPGSGDAAPDASTAAAPSAIRVPVAKPVTSPFVENLKSLRIRGLLQFDSRWFFQDAVVSNDAFVVRRARFYLEGQINRLVDVTLAPDFAGNAFTLLDANFNLNFSTAFQLRVGRFKPPVGLEYIQSDSWVFFIERSVATNFVPFRDMGVLAYGELLGGRLNYSAGIMNGVGDGASASSTGDYDGGKDLQARIFTRPFRGNPSSVFAGLGFGVAGTFGRQSSASAFTGGYRTDGQQLFFRYRALNASGAGPAQEGELWRLAPQAYYFQGPVGGMAEYIVSTVNVRSAPGGPKAELNHRAWQVSGSYVLTGEDASFTGVVPRHAFSQEDGNWGAFELTWRVSKLDVDDAAFPNFADPATSASAASSWGVGLNWYPSKAIRASIDYFNTSFDLAAPAVSNPLIRQDENALLTRLQLNF